MHMLETYKSQLDKFALCEGRPTPGNLYVLQVAKHTHTHTHTHLSNDIALLVVVLSPSAWFECRPANSVVS